MSEGRALTCIASCFADVRTRVTFPGEPLMTFLSTPTSAKIGANVAVRWCDFSVSACS